jgi:hypothetical protein
MTPWDNWEENPGMAFVDSSGKLRDSADFTFVNLRLAVLNDILEEMLSDGMDVKILCPTMGGISPLYIERLDGEGRLWRVFQIREMETEEITSPEIRFFYERESRILRPIDYRDPYVELEGTDKTSQLLISSFMMHWLSGILGFYAECLGQAADGGEPEDGERLSIPFDRKSADGENF